MYTYIVKGVAIVATSIDEAYQKYLDIATSSDK